VPFVLPFVPPLLREKTLSRLEYPIKVICLILKLNWFLFLGPIGGGLWTSGNPIKSPSDLFSFSHTRNTLRLEDSRLGALRTVSSSLGLQATVSEQLSHRALAKDSLPQDPEYVAGVGPHSKMGIGLAMSIIFARLVFSHCGHPELILF
jgi:hypothetical protein